LSLPPLQCKRTLFIQLPPPDKKTIWNLIVLVYCHSRLTPFGAPRTGYIMKQVFCFLLTFIQSFHSGIKKEPENSRMYTEMTLFNHPISTHTHPLLPATKNREEVFTFKCTGLYLLLYYTQFCMNFAYIFRKFKKSFKSRIKKTQRTLAYVLHTYQIMFETDRKMKKKKSNETIFPS